MIRSDMIFKTGDEEFAFKRVVIFLKSLKINIKLSLRALIYRES